MTDSRYRLSIHFHILKIMLKFLWILPLTLPSAATAGEAEVARVKAELPAAARRLDAMFAQVRGTARIRMENPHVTAKMPLTVAHFAVDHGMEKVELERFRLGSKPAKPMKIVYCISDDTVFYLMRKAGAPSYDIKGIGSELVHSVPADRYSYMSLFGRFVRAPHGAMWSYMSQILESPGFKILGAENLNRDGKALMRVELVWGPRDAREQAVFDFDPGAGWVVRSCLHNPGSSNPGEPPRLYRAEIEYGDSLRDGIPLPLHVRMDDPDLVVHHCEFTDWTFAPTPLAEFNMTHYGLPDLVKAHRKRNWLPYWLAGGAVLVGVLAFAFRRLASRGPERSRA